MKFTAAAFLVMVIAGAARADTVFDSTLALWAPTAIVNEDGKLTVILPKQRVTSEIYQTVVKSGICTAIVFDETALDGVNEMRVLNQQASRGFVAEGGKALCAELNAEAAGSGQSVTLLAVTHSY